MEMDDQFLDKIVFSDEAVFHVNVKVNKHNPHIWGTENPKKVLKYEHASGKIVLFAVISCKKVYRVLFFFVELTVTVTVYLNMLQNFLI
jgi:hypothetical protein